MALVPWGGDHRSPAIGSDERNPRARSCRFHQPSLPPLGIVGRPVVPQLVNDRVVGEGKTSGAHADGAAPRPGAAGQ